jgi:hypothetical protein
MMTIGHSGAVHCRLKKSVFRKLRIRHSRLGRRAIHGRERIPIRSLVSKSRRRTFRRRPVAGTPRQDHPDCRYDSAAITIIHTAASAAAQTERLSSAAHWTSLIEKDRYTVSLHKLILQANAWCCTSPLLHPAPSRSLLDSGRFLSVNSAPSVVEPGLLACSSADDNRKARIPGSSAQTHSSSY